MRSGLVPVRVLVQAYSESKFALLACLPRFLPLALVLTHLDTSNNTAGFIRLPEHIGSNFTSFVLPDRSCKHGALFQTIAPPGWREEDEDGGATIPRWHPEAPWRDCPIKRFASIQRGSSYESRAPFLSSARRTAHRGPQCHPRKPQKRAPREPQILPKAPREIPKMAPKSFQAPQCAWVGHCGGLLGKSSTFGSTTQREL